MSNQKERAQMSSHLPGFMLQKQHTIERNFKTSETTENGSEKELTVVLNKVKNELVNDKKSFLVEKIKKIIVDMVYYSEEQIKTNFSDYLSEKLGYNYTHMANMFTKIHGTSIQQFIIETKIERVKELLVYDNLTLTEISFKLYYSSVAHLSNQFKKVTGVNPSQFLATSIAYRSAGLTNSNETTNSALDESVILSMVTPNTTQNYQQDSWQAGAAQ